MHFLSPRSPIVRLSFVLAMLTSGLLVLSDVMGLFPNQYAAQLEARKTIAETVALQSIAAVENNAMASLGEVLEVLTRRHTSILSVAVRKNSGELVTAAGKHNRHWHLAAGNRSTETQVRVPIFNDSVQWGALEIAFTPLGEIKHDGGLPRSFALVVAFVALGGFAAYMLFLRRALRELDPSAVIPQRVRAALDALAEGLIIVDDKARILLVNASFAHKLGRAPESLVGTPVDSLGWLPVDSKDAIPARPWASVLAGIELEKGLQLKLYTAAKEPYTFAVNAVSVTGADGAIRGAMVTFDDLTAVERTNSDLRRTLQKVEGMQRDLARQNQELTVLATRDALSGALNRRALFDAFENLLRDSRSSGGELSCIMVDIDKFKLINDRYGHGTGDKVIKIVAGILSDTARATDLVGRYGGEEFCVLLPDAGLDKAIEVAERIRIAIQDSAGDNFSTPMRVTASFGVSSTAFGATTPIDLCNQADRALYVAKESGRNKVVGWPEVAAYVGAAVSDADTVLEVATPTAPPPSTAHTTAVSAAPSNHEQELNERISQLERALTDSERARAGEMMQERAGAVTNWAILRDRLQQALARSRRTHTHVATIVIEIEGYRAICSSLGLGYGEKLIDAAYERLRTQLRSGDTISVAQESDPGVVLVRLNADEFVLVLADLPEVDVVPRVIERVISAIAQSFEFDGEEIFVAPRIGISLFPGDGENATTLVANANAALRHTKQRPGKLPYHFYSSEMNARAVQQIRLESDLRRAIEHGEFVLHYQPRIEIASGRITGMEALIRWNHPTQGMTMPDKFIPLAEQLGLINAIGEWVIASACRQTAMWSKNGYGAIEIAVNISPVQMRDDSLLNILQAEVAAAGITPDRIELEVTESVVVDNIERIVALMNRLAEQGFKIALDDFGTGYSSLGYLRQFPLDRLKLDRSFLGGLGHNLTDYAIVSSVIEMAHTLGLRAVAEGVETEEQWLALRDLGCDEGQGYLLSRPVSVEDATALLQKGSPLRTKLRLISASDADNFVGTRPVAIQGVLNYASAGNTPERAREKIATAQ